MAHRIGTIASRRGRSAHTWEHVSLVSIHRAAHGGGRLGDAAKSLHHHPIVCSAREAHRARLPQWGWVRAGLVSGTAASRGTGKHATPTFYSLFPHNCTGIFATMLLTSLLSRYVRRFAQLNIHAYTDFSPPTIIPASFPSIGSRARPKIKHC